MGNTGSFCSRTAMTIMTRKRLICRQRVALTASSRTTFNTSAVILIRRTTATLARTRLLTTLPASNPSLPSFLRLHRPQNLKKPKFEWTHKLPPDDIKFESAKKQKLIPSCHVVCVFYCALFEG